LVTASLMDGERPDKVHIDEVILESGISKGSLYHHFQDFSDLIEAALIRRFSIHVDRNIEMIERLLVNSSNKEDFIEGLKGSLERHKTQHLPRIDLRGLVHWAWLEATFDSRRRSRLSKTDLPAHLRTYFVNHRTEVGSPVATVHVQGQS